MSWSAPKCPQCQLSSTRPDGPVCYGPEGAFAVAWSCDACKIRVIELHMIGPDAPAPGVCIDCDDNPLDSSGYCPACEQHHERLVARVHRHCGDPPSTEKILALRDAGLFRVAFNAVHLRLQANPEDADALATKGRLLLDVHRPARAVPVLRRALELGAEPGAHINLGVALADSGHTLEAIAVYERFLAEHPEDSGFALVLTNIGGCHSALGRREQAEVYHRRAIAADPEHLGPRWNLFANLYGRGRHAEALEVIEQTMQLPFLERDELENMHAYRSEMLIACGRLHDALAAIDASLASDPDELERLFTRGRILFRLGRLERARVVALRVLELVPESRRARELLERVNVARGVRPD